MCIWRWLRKQLFICSTLTQMQSPPGHPDYTILKKPPLWVRKWLFLGTPPDFTDYFLFSFVTRIWASRARSLSRFSATELRQTIQMHINKWQGAFNEIYTFFSPASPSEQAWGVALTSWSYKAVDHYVGLHWIRSKHLKRLWTSLPWGYCGIHGSSIRGGRGWWD